MQARHEFGKALWQKTMRPRLLQDAEWGLNSILDWLEWTQSSDIASDVFKRLYGEGPYANAPVRIGNDTYSITPRNLVGLPAGFTKDGRGLLALDAAGFGSIEIGTLVPAPQPGNLKPRFFVEYRETEDLLISVNRFGFNCEEGVEGAVQRVQKIWRERGEDAIKATLIWSFGPNKATMERYEETHDLRLIAIDIAYALLRMMPVLRRKDAISFNVASPNTPGLRFLFERFGELLELIMDNVGAVARISSKPVPPCIITLSPDMSDEQMRHVAIATAQHRQVIALRAFNTTIDEKIRAAYGIQEIGGVSGDPLEELTYTKLKVLNHILQEESLEIDVIAVGGITQPQLAVDRLSIALGKRVKAVQVLSGLFKDGFSLVSEIQEAVAKT